MGITGIQADGIVRVENQEIIIDFSRMTLHKLLAMRRLGVGMNAKYCDNWIDASQSAAKALRGYLDRGMFTGVVTMPDFTIRVTGGDIDILWQHLCRFFQRENITLEKYSGIRGVATMPT